MSTISAVVLTYNKAWVFGRFLSSLMKQTRPPDEVIVVDDCSEPCKRPPLETLPPIWKVVLLNENRGQSTARNRGFRESTGDYIIFLDGDIEMQPGMLDLMGRFLERHKEVSLVYCHYDRRGTRRGVARSLPWDCADLSLGNFISPMSLVRRKHLPDPPFDEKLRGLEDWDLWLRMRAEGRKGGLIDAVLFRAYYDREDISGMDEPVQYRPIVRMKHGLD